MDLEIRQKQYYIQSSAFLTAVPTVHFTSTHGTSGGTKYPWYFRLDLEIRENQYGSQTSAFQVARLLAPFLTTSGLTRDIYSILHFMAMFSAAQNIAVNQILYRIKI